MKIKGKDSYTLLILDVESDFPEVVYYVLLKNAAIKGEHLDKVREAIRNYKKEHENEETMLELEDVAIAKFKELGYDVITNIQSDVLPCN
jgi:hypothetical protein